MERDAVERIIREQEELQRRRPIYTLINLILPVLAMGAAVAVLAATGDLARVSAAVGISFFPVGKLIIVFGAAPNAPLKLSPYALAAIVFYMDVVVAYVFAFNLHHVSRIPKVGPAVMRMQYFCRYVLSTRPWMRRWAFTGVMLFVMFPVTGTGAPAGSILGRIVGLVGDEAWSEKDPFTLTEEERLSYSWAAFCRRVKHERRYFFLDEDKDVGDDPDRLLTAAETLKMVSKLVAEYDLVTAVPSGHALFRARSRPAKTDCRSSCTTSLP